MSQNPEYILFIRYGDYRIIADGMSWDDIICIHDQIYFEERGF